MLKPSSFQSDVDTFFLSAFLTLVISSDLTLYLKSYYKHYLKNNVFIVFAVTSLQHCIICIVYDINYSVTQTCFDQFNSLFLERTV